MCRFHLLSLLVTVVVLVAVVCPAWAQGTQEPTPEMPPYAVRGSYQVGVHYFTVAAAKTAGALGNNVTAWYPALNKAGVQGASSIKDAPPDTSGAPYPLVVFSPAFTAGPVTPIQYKYLGEQLASWGFVVLAPNHPGDDWNLVYPTTVKRLFDVKDTIKYAESLTATGGTLQAMIDTERIAVAGHSAGGSAAYGAAGAPLNWSSVEQYCTETGNGLCKDLLTQKTATQAMIGGDASQNDKWAAIWDQRVKAIVPMAGTAELYGKDGLSAITVPMLAMWGSADADAQWFGPAYEQVSSLEKAQVVFEGGDHLIFMLRGDSGMKKAQADQIRNLINHFTTAFLLDVLKGDKEAHKALVPDAVKFAGIQYKTTFK